MIFFIDINHDDLLDNLHESLIIEQIEENN